ncbi:hypothetical protein L596_004957 [Steinernema carpocapsae]|uniref:Uncharacterized protein n=1 Tax=Steinernema carpocapsae TaxID=34508 RepID=A0A4U8UXE6_STECR|nr:hypothetical protein L596_004957 [Steinernema carpocapsae]
MSRNTCIEWLFAKDRLFIYFGTFTKKRSCGCVRFRSWRKDSDGGGHSPFARQQQSKTSMKCVTRAMIDEDSLVGT